MQKGDIFGLQQADERVFIGLLASASARPQRSEDSQADGRPRPAFEGIRVSPNGLTGI